MKVLHYSPESGLKHIGVLLRDIIENFRQARELSVRMFTRDIKAGYREFFLGFFWAFSKPLGVVIPFAFLEQQNILQVDTGDIPPFAYMLICNTFWFVFVDTFTATRGLATTSMAILSKVRFAVEALYLAGVWRVLFNFGLQCIAIALVMIFWKIPLHNLVVFLPVAIFSLVLAGTALGFLLMPLVTLVKDLNNLVVTLVSLWFFITPIIYPPETEGLIGVFAAYNPITPLVVTAKQCMTATEFTMLPQFIMVTVVFTVLAILGLILQRIALPILVERMNA
ncbi:MAG: hypothetical protein AAGH72_01640 [Verrucomicrobiota bacterium]